jgi:NAD(P)-dependent dehydrogenase (short-subunit alcohol dehydrogenase family)
MGEKMSQASTAQRTVAVTGAASGIGKALAQAFAKRGFRVALVDRAPGVRAVAAELGGEHAAYLIDVASESSVEDGAARMRDELGDVDTLVNNAGIALLGCAADYPKSDWDATIATNLTGVFLCSRVFGRRMVQRGWGRIINIASQNAVQGYHGHVAYSAAKAGIIGMGQVLAAEWGPHGVTVNSVSPTLVSTPMAMETWTAQAREHVEQRLPTRRLATVADVAAAVLYLAEDAAGMINGHNLMVDGGASRTF